MNRLQLHLTGLVCAAGLSAGAAAQDGPVSVEIRGEPGNFMLYRSDGRGRVAHANIPFYVDES